MTMIQSINNNGGFDRLFVGGDLSGIQAFLYNISSRKASVSLKGRSRYLSNYMSDVCGKLCSAALSAGATSTREIYSSGGKFYIITENTQAVVDVVNDIAEKEKKTLWDEHNGLLSINIGYEPFSENADGSVNVEGREESKIGVLWERVNAEFARQKNQKFKSMLIENYEEFFEINKVGGKPDICAVTGIEGKKCVKIKGETEDKDMLVLPSVEKQIRLGEKLRNEEGSLTFEEYANGSYLGILRMDVDGLGARFIKGFDSFDKYEEFSKGLCDYFEKDLRTKWETEEYKNYLNIIYAGGDDLFVVGHWNKVIEFAASVHDDVERDFAKENIHISGGVAIVHDKYPIAKAALMAGEAEDAAKDFRDGEKNAFCMFGKTVSWEREFGFVRDYKEQFVMLIDNGLPRGILHKLMLYASIIEKNKGQEEKDYSYMWHTAYYLTRIIERNKDNKSIVEFCKQLRDTDLVCGDRNYELIALAARWAELETKKNNN